MSRKAILSAILGALSFFLFILTGLPAIFLGFLSLREINASDGRMRGRPLALFGMIAGAVGSLLFIAGLTAIVLLHLRETAARAMCEANLGRLGLALNLYYDRHDHYPAGTIPAAELPVEKRLSWLVAVLPNLEPDRPPAKGQPTAWQELFDRIDRRAAWDAEANLAVVGIRLRWCRCPSDDHKLDHSQPVLTDYIGIAGIGRDAATLPVEAPRAGLFGYERHTSRRDIHGGISNTMAVTETAWENGPWAAGGPATLRGVEPESRPYIGYGRPFGGLHPKGINVLFVDNSVRFVRQSIQPETFEQLATIHSDEEMKNK